MDRWIGKTAVVTGASAGIGAAIAVALADSGLNVVAGARRMELLQDLQNHVKGRGRIIPCKCDVTKQEDIVQLIECAKKYGGVDVLVNNAAILLRGTVTDCNGKGTPLRGIEECFKTNVLGIIGVTRLAAADMVRRKVAGTIIILNSIAGHKFPSMGGLSELSVYPTTKHALTALAETIRLEFSFTEAPIRVTSISPGAVDTEMLRLALPGIVVPMLKTEDIADVVLYVLAAPNHVNFTEITVQVTGEKY